MMLIAQRTLKTPSEKAEWDLSLPIDFGKNFLSTVLLLKSGKQIYEENKPVLLPIKVM